MRDGTTLVELLTVISIISLLAALLMPALLAANRRAKATVCLNNQAELVRAWHVYIADFSDGLPPNGYQYDGKAYRSEVDSWIGDSNAVLDTNSAAIERGLFYRFHYNNVVALYRCPADRARVTGAQANGVALPLRTRSYSMSSTFGGRTNATQTVFHRFAEASEPTKLFVFLDENEVGIDDGHFRTWPNPDPRWVNMPTDRHDQAGAFSFADGHVELWRWRYSKLFRSKKGYWKKAETPADLSDLRRLQEGVPPPPMGWEPAD